MGKTVTAILIIAAVVAVNFIPGVGQAISAGLISAGLATTAATAAATAASIIATATSIGLATAGSLLFGPKLPKPGTTEGPLKTAIPQRVSAYGRSRLYGAYVLYESIGSSEAVDVYAIHDGRIDAIEQRYLADDRVTKGAGGVIVAASPSNDGRYVSDNVFWYETLGEDPGPGLPGIAARLPAKWTANHRGDGVVLVGTYWHAPKSETFAKRFPQGGPVPASVVARWQLVFDWRDLSQSVTDPSTWKWSENALLHLAHYRLVREKARRVPGEVLPSAEALADAWKLFFAPTIAYWTEAANVCDEVVPLKSGGTEPRYRSCFSHHHTDPHKDVIDALTACFDGWTSPRADGALVVYAGKYYAPTVSVGPREIVSYAWNYGIVDETAVNEITITYVSADHDFATVPATSWQDLDDISARGAIRSTSLENPVPSHGQARRLVKRLVARTMARSRGTITTNVAGRTVRGQRFIRLRIEEAGAVFFDGVAEIIQLVRNIATGGVTFSWIEADPNIDAWNPATEEGDPATETPRVVSEPLDAPTIVDTFTVFEGSSADGTGTRVEIHATAPGSAADVQSYTWFARWRVEGATIWNEQRYTDTDPLASVELITGFVPVNTNIEVEVAYQSGDGRVSPYSNPPTLIGTDTEAVAPDAAVAISMVEWVSSLTLSTPVIPRASTYRWRFYASDGVSLIRTLVTTGRTVSYGKDLAATDGALRAYKVEVAGVNAAGAGSGVTSGLLTKAPPAAVTDLSVPDNATTAAINFTPLVAGAASGYVFYYSTTTGFAPLTTGIPVYGAGSPFFAYGLGATTYYGKIAAYDEWSDRPDLLNFSAEESFVITAGGGSIGGGGTGDPGAGGGGYCVTTDAMIQMADGSLKAAGELEPGDMVRTQHETTMAWGDYPVTAIEVVHSDDVWQGLGIRATGDHRVFLNAWVRMRDVGEPTAPADVVRITVEDAHTYYSNGVLSHNIKIRASDA